MSGLYLHIPFCKSKCVYCGFYSTVNQKDVDKYVSFLIKEMALRCHETNDESIKTVYFGGGTPSLLQISQLQQIINNIKQHFSIEENAEMTIEANPEQLTAEYCKELKTIGFNRISIGIQSFQDEILRFLGRRHTAQEALNAVNNAHNAGFDMGVLKKCLHDYGILWRPQVPGLCTVRMGRRLLPGISHRLGDMCAYYGIDLRHHRADSDSLACAQILLRYLESGAEPERFIRTYPMI